MLLKTVIASGLSLLSNGEVIQSLYQQVFEPRAFNSKSTTFPCQYWQDDKWYDLTDFDNEQPFFLTTPHGGSQTYAAFNFCQKLNKDTVQVNELGCSDASTTDSYATIVNHGSTGTCLQASTDSYSSIHSTTYVMADGSETFALKYQNDDNKCSLLVGLICDEDAEVYTTTGLITSTGDGACNYQTTLTSSQVCATFDLNALWEFMEDYDYLWGVLLIVAGILVGFFGVYVFNATIFLVTTMLVVFGILLLFYTTFLEDTTQTWVGWTVLSCSIIIGLVCGYFMVKLEKIPIALAAGFGGFLLGVMINEMALYKAESNALFWCVSIGVALGCAVLSFFLAEHVLINMTSFAGAYMLVRGISLYAGGFPNEFTLVEQLQAGDTSAMTNWFYLYMVCILIVAAAGSFVQYRMNRDNEKAPYRRLK